MVERSERFFLPVTFGFFFDAAQFGLQLTHFLGLVQLLPEQRPQQQPYHQSKDNNRQTEVMPRQQRIDQHQQIENGLGNKSS